MTGPPIRFPAVADPAVSILMVTYGAWDWARRALEAVLDNTPPVYEVIVVDNASPDGTGDRLLEHVEGATIVLSERNVGLGSGLNLGAARARGVHLVTLQSDCLVHPGWLPPLMETLESHARIGAVGPRQLRPDGLLRLTSGLVFRDATTRLVGHGDDPERPEHRFPRVVDYLSAACLLIRRPAFVSIGGFDAAYSPLYYTDADLAFALYAAGFYTVFQPGSTVTHAGGVSTPPQQRTDLSARNRTVFAGLWGDELVSRPPSPDGSDDERALLAARDSRSRDRVAVVATGVPASGGEGDLQPAARLVVATADLCRWGRVTLLVTDGQPDGDRGADADWLLERGLEVITDTAAEEVLLARLSHYDAVLVVGTPPSPRLLDSIAAAQPRALVITDALQALEQAHPSQYHRHLAHLLAPGGIAAVSLPWRQVNRPERVDLIGHFSNHSAIKLLRQLARTR